MAYIELNGVSKGFGSGAARSEVLDGIDLHIEQGELVAILGYSGTGKSTLVNLIAGLLEPDKGDVIVDGERVEGPSPSRGLVFQNYSLLPWMNVYQNVALAVEEVFPKESRKERDRRVRHAIDRVNLGDALHKLPGELSGGMRQRNSVARTLSMNPAVLLLDEPLSALDALTRSVVQDQILEIWKEEGQTILLITNDVDEALYMADRIIPLSVGPAASLGAETEVDLPRPRDRRQIATDTSILKLRNQVINFLLAEKEKEKGRGEGRAVSLPNIRPMDITRAKPTTYIGHRPKAKKELTES